MEPAAELEFKIWGNGGYEGSNGIGNGDSDG